jgi:hypothetical protein
MQKYFYTLMKGIASGVTLGAIGVELWGRIPGIFPQVPFPLPNFFPIGAHIVLIAHGMEGVVAAAIARRSYKNPFTIGLYTFFVGTIALMELFSRDASVANQKVHHG